MHWGLEHSAGHYVDLVGAVLGLTLFPAGYFLHALPRGKTSLGQEMMNQEPSSTRPSWLKHHLGNRAYQSVQRLSRNRGLPSLPAFLASLGAGPGWLGAIEGTADGLSSFSKLAAGHYTDRLKHRKPLVESGYILHDVGYRRAGIGN